jgi:hypothetical protein
MRLGIMSLMSAEMSAGRKERERHRYCHRAKVAAKVCDLRDALKICLKSSEIPNS